MPNSKPMVFPLGAHQIVAVTQTLVREARLLAPPAAAESSAGLCHRAAASDLRSMLVA